MQTSPHHDLPLLTSPTLWVCALAGALVMTTAHAANDPDNLTPPSNASSMSAKQAYEHDKAFCNSQQATEPRALCLKEAERAYTEAKAGVAGEHHAAVSEHAMRHHHRRHQAQGDLNSLPPTAAGTRSSAVKVPDTNSQEQTQPTQTQGGPTR